MKVIHLKGKYKELLVNILQKKKKSKIQMKGLKKKKMMPTILLWIMKKLNQMKIPEFFFLKNQITAANAKMQL